MRDRRKKERNMSSFKEKQNMNILAWLDSHIECGGVKEKMFLINVQIVQTKKQRLERGKLTRKRGKKKKSATWKFKTDQKV